MQGYHFGSHKPKRFKNVKFQKKTMATVFRDIKETDLLEPEIKITLHLPYAKD